MAFYGSLFSNDKLSNSKRVERHARHIACPQRLKYIHDVKDGYIPYVEDSKYPMTPVPTQVNRSGLYNTADAWRRELMGLAQQVQTSFDDSRSARLSQRSRKPNENFISNSFAGDQRLLTGRRSTINRPKLLVDENPIIKNQDSGIWLLPILCYTLHVDNIFDAQEWLLNANPTEKRLAMELISRTMQDMQNYEDEFVSDSIISDKPLSSVNNLYWPYKFWQHRNYQQQQQQQQQSKSMVDLNDTCERATSPVRFVTPGKQSSTVQNRLNLESRSSSSPRLLTPMLPTPLPSRRSHRISTSRSTISNFDANSLRGKTPLI